MHSQFNHSAPAATQPDVAPAQSGTSVTPSPFSRVLSPDDYIGIGMFLLALPLVIALARRIWVRSTPQASAALDATTQERLSRLEMSVDVIAVEMERVGETQRFAAQLLAERLPEKHTLNAPAPAPVSRREPGYITPH